MATTDWRGSRRAWVVTGGAVAPFVLCAIFAGFRDSVTTATAAVVLVLVVVCAAASGDRAAGLVAALSSGAWFDFFLTEPYHTFAIDGADDIEVTVLLLVIGGLVSEIALWGRRQQARASVREGYLQGVLATAESISVGTESPDRLAGHVADRIAEVMEVTHCRFVRGSVHDGRYAVLERDGSLTRNGHTVPVDRGLPTDEETVLPVRVGTETLGYFLLTSASEKARPSMEQRRVAMILADQMGAALGSA